MCFRKGGCLFLVFLTLFSCQHELEVIERPSDLIPSDSFELVLEELMLIESLIRVKHRNINEFYKPMKVSGVALLEKYNIDTTRFYQSMNYYTHSQEELIEMYQAIEMRAKKRIESLDTLR